jgi:hypothetical protein
MTDRSVEALARFGAVILEEARDGLGDLDGGWLQDNAEKLGLLESVEVNEPCGDQCLCAEYADFPQLCLRLRPEIEQAITALQAPAPASASSVPDVVMEPCVQAFDAYNEGRMDADECVCLMATALQIVRDGATSATTENKEKL